MCVFKELDWTEYFLGRVLAFFIRELFAPGSGYFCIDIEMGLCVYLGVGRLCLC